ncbi:SWIM zinc finger family protein [Paracoccus denitrificans]
MRRYRILPKNRISCNCRLWVAGYACWHRRMLSYAPL